MQSDFRVLGFNRQSVGLQMLLRLLGIGADG
jgi:hypothetical protein